MNKLVSRAITAWRAWQAAKEVARKRRQFQRANPHIVAFARKIEWKRKRHLPTRADMLELRRMTNAALRGDA